MFREQQVHFNFYAYTYDFFFLFQIFKGVMLIWKCAGGRKRRWTSPDICKAEEWRWVRGANLGTTL